MNEAEKINTLNKWITGTNPGEIVFFGGAGMSTESGIPDFRSADGIYNQSYKYPPEVMISRSFFDQNPGEFYKFYFDKMIPEDSIMPNAAHYKLAELEKRGLLSAVITQNIDGLHQKAGAKNVLELHGSILRNYCMNCNEFYDLETFKNIYLNFDDNIPRCQQGKCKGIIKPDVVLYEEALNNTIMQQSVDAISKADMMIIAGTSLAVYPAAGLLDYFNGSHLVIINMSSTPKDNIADLCFNDKVGAVFSQIK